MAFWWPWPPFGLPKHLQNETQKGVKIKSWNSLILRVFTTLEPHLRVLKIIIFRCFFGTPFWDAFGSPFWWFWLSFGVPFGDHFHHFPVPFLHRFLEGFQGLPESRVGPGWRGIRWYLGSSYKYYRSKSASLQKVVSLSANQLICRQQISRSTEQLTCR